MADYDAINDDQSASGDRRLRPADRAICPLPLCESLPHILLRTEHNKQQNRGQIVKYY